jgi:Rho termination factor-like protein
LDNPEPTPEQTPTNSKETPATTTPTNGPATNGPATNGGGAATAAATRREAPPAVPSRKYYTITELNEKKPKELVEIAKEFNVEGAAGLGQQDLITRILQAQTEAQGAIFAQGILEIVEDGFGFLRRRSLLPSP